MLGSTVPVPCGSGESTPLLEQGDDGLKKLCVACLSSYTGASTRMWAAVLSLFLVFQFLHAYAAVNVSWSTTASDSSKNVVQANFLGVSFRNSVLWINIVSSQCYPTAFTIDLSQLAMTRPQFPKQC